MRKQTWGNLSNSPEATEQGRGGGPPLRPPRFLTVLPFQYRVLWRVILSELRERLGLLKQSPHGRQRDQLKGKLAQLPPVPDILGSAQDTRNTGWSLEVA